MSVRTSVLEHHVRESNALERISVGPRHPLFRGHLEAARLVARGTLVHPNSLHRALLLPTSQHAIAGRIRTCRLYIGRHELPPPEKLPALMDEWWRLVEAYWRLASGGPRKRWADLAWFIHLQLLAIHPYVDGNGRTARLVHNMLRLRARLPWKTVSRHDARTYHRLVRRFEVNVFLPSQEQND